MKFDFVNPTRLVFGPGVFERLGDEAAKIGKNALLVTGRGSVRRMGLLDKALAKLRDAGVRAMVFEGVQPNPRLSTVEAGVRMAKEGGCDMVVALGGGSVMDAAKVMAAGVFYEGDLWDMFRRAGHRQRLPERALPILTVPTLAATGSEMNAGAVITNEESAQKTYCIAPCMFPRTALADPELTVSVPRYQTACGIVDIITHVTESYFNSRANTPIQDGFAEAVVRCAIEYGSRAVQNGMDLEARTQVQWASIVALNGWVQVGTAAPYPVHQIGHVLSAHHDLPHGATLAIASPAWMRFACMQAPERFVRFARNVFRVEASSTDDIDAGLRGIAALEAFFKELGCPTRLSDAGLPKVEIPSYARDAVLVGGDGERLDGVPEATEEDIRALLEAAYE